jgi:membrane protease YdiL (CAAX protease family)
MNAAMGFWRPAWIQVRLRLQRQLNMTSVGLTLNKTSRSRKATPGKSKAIGISLIFGSLMLFTFGSMARGALGDLYCEFGASAACDAAHRVDSGLHLMVADFASHGFAPALLGALGFLFTLVYLSTLLGAMATREMSRPDWDLEWLVTMPVPRASLLWSRVLMRALVSPVGWMTGLPLALVLAWYGPQRAWLPLTALIAVASVLGLGAAMLTVFDTGLRLRLSPDRLRNVQGVCTVFSLVPMYMAMAYGMPGHPSFMNALAGNFPAWAAWTPPGLAVRMLCTPDWLLPAALLMLETFVLMVACVGLVQYWIRDGIVGSGARDSGRTSRRSAPAARSVGTPVQRRELRLLARDRNFMMQTLLLPVVIIGSQLLFQGKLNTLNDLHASANALSLTAFGIGAYMLMMSAFQTLATEGQALWLLYTVPQPLSRILFDKARLWGSLVLLYPILIFSLGGPFSTSPWDEVVRKAGFVLLGLPVFAAIGVALGVFGVNPLTEIVETRVRPTYMYLYMMLAGIYSYAITLAPLSQTVVFLILLMALAMALWQKAHDRLPYLLDPVASPPERVSAADGLIAALVFSLCQSLIMAFVSVAQQPGLRELVYAFGLAGLITYLLTRYTFWRLKTSGVPRIWQGRLTPTLLWGLGGGAGVALLGWAYLAGLDSMGLKPPGTGQDRDWWLLLTLTVVAAPLSEEFIFRGLIFGGLARSLRPWQATCASAAIFAVVHPPISMLPVFCLGLVTAHIYRRTGGLVAPMLAHGVYNLVILLVQ